MTVHYTIAHYTTLHYTALQLTPASTTTTATALYNYTTLQLQLHYNYNCNCTTPHYIQQLWLCHPGFTATNLSYRFPIFETFAATLCGTTGKS